MGKRIVVCPACQTGDHANCGGAKWDESSGRVVGCGCIQVLDHTPERDGRARKLADRLDGYATEVERRGWITAPAWGYAVDECRAAASAIREALGGDPQR